MFIVDKIRNKEDYPNNMQREIAFDEFKKALELYKEFEKYFNEKIKNLNYNDVSGKLNHNSMCSIEYVNDSYTDFIYGDEHKDGVSVFLTINNKENKPSLSNNIDIFVKDLDYEYNYTINEEIQIVE